MYVRCNGQCFKEIISLRDLAMLPDTSSRPCDTDCSGRRRRRSRTRGSVWISLPSEGKEEEEAEAEGDGRRETGHPSLNETWAQLGCLNLLNEVAPFFAL